jgi:hypothetical protein
MCAENHFALDDIAFFGIVMLALQYGDVKISRAFFASNQKPGQCLQSPFFSMHPSDLCDKHAQLSNGR